MDQFFWERTGSFNLGRLLCRLPDGVWLLRAPRFINLDEVEQSAVVELPGEAGDKCYVLSQRTLLKLIERNAIGFDWTQLYFFEGEHALSATGFAAECACQVALHCVDGTLWQIESHDPELIQYLAGTEAGFYHGGTWREMPCHPVVTPLHAPPAEQTPPPLAASLAPPLGAQEAARIRQGWERMSVLGAKHDSITGLSISTTLGMGSPIHFAFGAARTDISRAERRLGFSLPEEIKVSCGVFNGMTEWLLFGVEGYWRFADVDRIRTWLLDFRDEVTQCPPFRCAPGTRPPEFGPQLIPFATGPDHTAYCLDYRPGEGGTPGQVSAVCFDDASVAVAAGSYAEFLEQQIRCAKRALNDCKHRRESMRSCPMR